MKKSLLALAVVAVAASANAATVYDKDGTSLYLDGRVQSVFYSGNHNKAGENDSSINNSGRFGIGGKTQITDWVAGIGYSQWDASDGDNRDKFAVRDQWVGADFGEFGKLQAGRFRDGVYYVEEVTDHYEDAADNLSGNFNGERRNGQLKYTYDNYGFHGELGVQTAQNSVKVFGDKHGFISKGVDTVLGGYSMSDSYDVDSGFNVGLGYTFDDVLFGPLSFRAGYNYIKGQKDGDANVSESFDVDANGNVQGVSITRVDFDKFKHAAGSIVWGNLSSGLYLAGLYDYAKMEGIGQSLTKDAGLDNLDVKVKGFELAVGYAFDNGVSMLVGYESAKYEAEGAADSELKVKRIPVFVNYKINPNFNVWGEVGFNAGSDHDYDITTAGNQVRTVTVGKNVDHAVCSVGARYTF